MTLNYNVTGSERKRLVHVMSEILECPSKYLGMPSCAYEVDYFIIDKLGGVTFDDRADTEEIERLIERLYEEGFVAENLNVEEERCFTAKVPFDGFTVQSMENLQTLVDAKADLLKRALEAKALPINHIGEYLEFPWFPGDATADEVSAYTHLVAGLCEMAKNQKRITAKAKAEENEKYAMRCFLLRLGFIGDEYKSARKILLRNLSGSSAYKGGAKHEISR